MYIIAFFPFLCSLFLTVRHTSAAYRVLTLAETQKQPGVIVKCVLTVAMAYITTMLLLLVTFAYIAIEAQ